MYKLYKQYKQIIIILFSSILNCTCIKAQPEGCRIEIVTLTPNHKRRKSTFKFSCVVVLITYLTLWISQWYLTQYIHQLSDRLCDHCAPLKKEWMVKYFIVSDKKATTIKQQLYLCRHSLITVQAAYKRCRNKSNNGLQCEFCNIGRVPLKNRKR